MSAPKTTNPPQSSQAGQHSQPKAHIGMGESEEIESQNLKELSSKVKQALDSQPKTDSIKWDEYNFPPLCKFVHFRFGKYFLLSLNL